MRLFGRYVILSWAFSHFLHFDQESFCLFFYIEALRRDKIKKKKKKSNEKNIWNRNFRIWVSFFFFSFYSSPSPYHSKNCRQEKRIHFLIFNKEIKLSISLSENQRPGWTNSLSILSSLSFFFFFLTFEMRDWIYFFFIFRYYFNKNFCNPSP